MPSTWSVTTESLKQSAERLQEMIQQYNTEWGRLYTEIENLKSSSWQGIASDTFNAKIEAYRESFQELETVLKSYVEFLRSASQQYESTENAIKDAAGNLNMSI